MLDLRLPDTRIAIDQSKQLVAAARAAGVDVTTWWPEGCEHMQVPAHYPDEFEERLVAFYDAALGP